MAATVLSSVAPHVSSPLRNTESHKQISCSSSISLSSSNLQNFPSLSSSATQQKFHHGRVVVACLPSAPKSSSTQTSTKLYVSGLSFRTTEESLKNAFQNFGELVEVNLVMDRIANRPRGFAFLRYATEEESKKAIEGMHGKFLDGRVIFVEVAKPRSELRQGVKQSPRHLVEQPLDSTTSLKTYLISIIWAEILLGSSPEQLYPSNQSKNRSARATFYVFEAEARIQNECVTSISRFQLPRAKLKSQSLADSTLSLLSF
ncbi:RNA recognition motif domain [Macleaya cordata]|uniref:RNA recognition motif domain n=1 Tax=Macleaya cordata TaxID=56857 RepID=A0A200RAC9_MACCD|nr:RNA recognition motif domain [Macleaya cordata]